MSIFWPPKGRPSLPWLPPRLPNAPQPGQNPFDFLSLPPSIPLAPPLPRSPAPTAIPEVKRKVYFAFTFSDILRVNNVRQIGKIGPRESRNARTFF